jgi:hypothetical protein
VGGCCPRAAPPTRGRPAGRWPADHLWTALRGLSVVSVSVLTVRQNCPHGMALTVSPDPVGASVRPWVRVGSSRRLSARVGGRRAETWRSAPAVPMCGSRSLGGCQRLGGSERVFLRTLRTVLPLQVRGPFRVVIRGWSWQGTLPSNIATEHCQNVLRCLYGRSKRTWRRVRRACLRGHG